MAALAPTHPPLQQEEAPTRDAGKWETHFMVKCDSAEQKDQLKALAKKAGRSLSRYTLLKALQQEADENAWKERAANLDEDVKRWRADYYRAKADAEEAQRRNRDLEGQLDEVQRQLSQQKITLSRADTELQFLDARVLHLLASSKDEASRPVPMLERELIIRLDKVTDAGFITILQARLAELDDLGLIQQVQQHGKTAYQWSAQA